MKRLTILTLIIISCAFRSNAQDVRFKLNPDITNEYYGADGELHYSWSPGSFFWDKYDQERSWMENPNPRFSLYIMPLGIM